MNGHTERVHTRDGHNWAGRTRSQSHPKTASRWPRLAAVGVAAALSLVACSSTSNSEVGDLVLLPPTAQAAEPPAPSATTAAPEPTNAASPTVAATPPDLAAREPGVVEVLRPIVIESFPHDAAAFTQGLELVDDQLVESTGAPESVESVLRRVDLESGAVVQQVDVPGDVFAEGLTKVGDELVQLTWQAQRAFFWDAETFELRREVAYQGQGWGLCFDGERLIMSDGSTQLFFRDPVTFELIGQVTVTNAGAPVQRLNELECVNGEVWANVWLTDVIVRITPDSGVITAIVDGSSLGRPRTEAMDVLNGIAWDSQTETWLVTGKFWPELYRVQFVTVD